MSSTKTHHINQRSQSCHEFAALNRRAVLQAGALAALGLGLPDLWSATAALANESNQVALRTASGRKAAKACIFMFMWGGPSQLDTFDLKPDAPDEIRGSFKPVSTNVPGIQICEHFSRLSKHVDKLAIVRSLNHSDPAHLSSGHATVTGQPAPVLNSDANPPSERDSPHIGSLVSKVRPNTNGLPSFVTLPWKAFHPAAPGQHGGWLGKSYDGMLLSGDPNAENWKPSGLSLRPEITLSRLEERFHLLKRLNQQQPTLNQPGFLPRPMADAGAHRSRAIDLLTSTRVRRAFDLSEEPASIRDRYGRNTHGQSVLMARRLVEHGVPLVTVTWHNDGKNFWDTHGNNFKRLKDDLIPPADMALSTLLADLNDRGMLEETLVVWVGEFGRKPQITAKNSGREHWPFCYSGLLAGGGIRGGMTYGTSDAHAAYPNSDPVTPMDFGTTIVDALGIPTDSVLPDREGRPHPVTSGKIIEPLFS
ncbi:MAG: DUF1501 domain-containing protein [Rubripirellula sp.]